MCTLQGMSIKRSSPEMMHITSEQNPLVHTSYITPPNHKGLQTVVPHTQKGRGLKMFGG